MSLEFLCLDVAAVMIICWILCQQRQECNDPQSKIKINQYITVKHSKYSVKSCKSMLIWSKNYLFATGDFYEETTKTVHFYNK